MASVTFSTYDRNNKRSSMTIHADNAVTNLNVQSVVDALDAIIVGTATRGVVTVPNVVDAGAAGPSADLNAERGQKWLFRVQSTAGADIGQIFQHELGTADNAVLPNANSDFIDLTVVPGLTLKTAWDTIWESPIGSTGSLLSVQRVNRAEN